MDTFIRAASFGCFLFTFIVLIVVAALIFTVPRVPENVPTQRLCLPSASDEGVITCGPQAEMLNVYLDQAIKEDYDREEAKLKNEHLTNGLDTADIKAILEESKCQPKPAARVTGDANGGPEPYSADLSIVRHWRVGNHDYTRYGVKYREGRLVVPVSGTYMVYCFLDMYESWNKTTNRPVQNCSDSIRLEVYKYNILDSNEISLMKSQQPHQMSPNGHYNIYGSYISSIVQLKTGDEVYVKVSDIGYLQNPYINYFGINMI